MATSQGRKILAVGPLKRRMLMYRSQRARLRTIEQNGSVAKMRSNIRLQQRHACKCKATVLTRWSTLQEGGALFIATTKLVIKNSTFVGNSGYHGGALYVFSSNTVTISGTHFESNRILGIQSSTGMILGGAICQSSTCRYLLSPPFTF